MRPLTLNERLSARPTVSLKEMLSGSMPKIIGSTDVRLEDYTNEILVGGFPGMRMTSERAQRAALGGYLDRIVDRDFAEAGASVRNPAALRRWMAAYAAATSTTASYETIRNSATSGQGQKPARTTTIPYRDTLERLWIVDPIPAWLPTRNHLARLATAPKHHLADPALSARLLGLDAKALLSETDDEGTTVRDGTFLGALFESLVTLCVRVCAQTAEAQVHHLRTESGRHEIDLIITRPDQRVVALEVKLAQKVTSRDVKHLLWLKDTIGNDLLDAAVITTGPHAYRRDDGIAVIPASLLGV